MARQDKRVELQRLREQLAQLESELGAETEEATPDWAPRSYYTTYHLLAGMVLGFIGAAASLLFNVAGAAILGKHPLQLIRVYLTFPLGEKALSPQLDNAWFLLAAGCCLYLSTGMIGGIPFHMILSRFFAKATPAKRFLVTTILALGVWLINYYAVLYWLQPMLIGGSWIVDEIPIPVAIATHLVFGWTLLAVDHWGRFVPPEERRLEESR